MVNNCSIIIDNGEEPWIWQEISPTG